MHEVLPVTDGCRLTLVYNLLRRGSAAARCAPPGYACEQASRRGDAATQLADRRAGRRQPKLIYPLEHAYTPAELAFDTLKGADAAVAGVLAARPRRQADCDLHLALLTVEEAGIAEYSGDYRRGWSRTPMMTTSSRPAR